MDSASSCEWSSIQHHLVSCFCRSVVGGGGSEQQTGPQSLFVKIGRNKEKGLQIGCFKGGGAEQHKGPQSLFVE